MLKQEDVESRQGQNLPHRCAVCDACPAFWLCKMAVESLLVCDDGNVQNDGQGYFCFHDEETDSFAQSGA